MFTRRSAPAAAVACAACWLGAAAHAIAEPAPYEGARSLLIGGGIALALLLLLTRHQRPVSPMTTDVIDAIDVHATRMCEADEPCAPVIPLPCAPAPAHRRLARASAAILVASVVGGLAAFGWDGAERQDTRPPRPPVHAAPPPTGPPAQPPPSPMPSRRDRDQPPATGRETAEATSPSSPSARPSRPGTPTSDRSARGGGRAPVTSPTGSAPVTSGSTGPSAPSPSDEPTTTAGGGAEPAPTRTPIRRVIRRVTD